VHLRAGLRCVDCHPAGRSARDPRISAREEHQIAKGDDPGGLVRDDLDDTVVGCADCHESGRRGAPVAKHFGLPALHLERIACQACHVPERVVMPAEVQASDVFNQAPWIHSAGKRLWTFYGPDGRARNHYGFLEVMGYDDKPTEPFRPTLFRYKGKIYPGNRVHSAWPGLEIEGETALAQPRVGDIVKMWKAHLDDPKKYEALSEIADDTGDGVPEVNRPEEIDALLASVRQALASGRLSEGHARALLALPTPQAQSAAAQTVLKRGLNVRQTEELVQRLTGHRRHPTTARRSPEESEVENQLRQALGTKVTLRQGRKGGSLVIHFYSEEELEALLERLLGS